MDRILANVGAGVIAGRLGRTTHFHGQASLRVNNRGAAANIGAQVSCAGDAGAVNSLTVGDRLAAAKAGLSCSEVIFLHRNREAGVEHAEDGFIDKHLVASSEYPIRATCNRRIYRVMIVLRRVVEVVSQG